jgi:hypothetical protein
MISELITQLTNETTSFVTIDNARDLQPVNTQSNELPALFVFRGDAVMSRSNADNRVTQRRDQIVSVYLVCDHAEVEELENEIFDALLGWQYKPEYTGLEAVKSEVISITGQTVWHQIDFTTWNTLRVKK